MDGASIDSLPEFQTVCLDDAEDEALVRFGEKTFTGPCKLLPSTYERQSDYENGNQRPKENLFPHGFGRTTVMNRLGGFIFEGYYINGKKHGYGR